MQIKKIKLNDLLKYIQLEIIDVIITFVIVYSLILCFQVLEILYKAQINITNSLIYFSFITLMLFFFFKEFKRLTNNILNNEKIKLDNKYKSE